MTVNHIAVFWAYVTESIEHYELNDEALNQTLNVMKGIIRVAIYFSMQFTLSTMKFTLRVSYGKFRESDYKDELDKRKNMSYG